MELSIQNVIDRILSTVPGAPFAGTVDTVKTGDQSQPVSGIVTTFQANVEVIHKAIELGANFIITHEPTFYNHLDETGWLEGDAVYSAKRKLAEDNHIVIWRFHDTWHTHKPDGIAVGETQALGWENYADAEGLHLFTLPATTLVELARVLKERLGIRMLRFVGDPNLVVRRVGFLMGGSGGASHLRLLRRDDVDLLIAGEIAEWETSEYVRDANCLGFKKGLIVAGHEQTEEAGMAYLVEWLKPHIPGISITHVASDSPFTWL